MDAGRIYWTNLTGHTISEANLDGTSVQGFITGPAFPAGAAVVP